MHNNIKRQQALVAKAHLTGKNGTAVIGRLATATPATPAGKAATPMAQPVPAGKATTPMAQQAKGSRPFVWPITLTGNSAPAGKAAAQPVPAGKATTPMAQSTPAGKAATPVAQPAKKGPSPFGQAFASARSQGKQSFDFGGKSYNTRYKGESKKDWLAGSAQRLSQHVKANGMAQGLSSNPKGIKKGIESAGNGTPKGGRFRHLIRRLVGGGGSSTGAPNGGRNVRGGSGPY